MALPFCTNIIVIAGSLRFSKIYNYHRQCIDII